MEHQLSNDELMIRYLLRESSEQEQMELEERYFGDDEYFEQLLTVEDELIDAYVQGKLTSRAREQFERQFLTTPQRCQRVEFSRGLMRAVEEEPAPATLAPTTARQEAVSWWQSVLDMLRAQNRVLGMLRAQNRGLQMALTAAVVALLLGGSWLVVDSLRRRTALEQPEAERAARRQQEQESRQRAGEQHARNDQLSNDAQRAQREQELANQQPPEDRGQASNRVPRIGERARQRAPRSTIASFMLTPGLVRDTGESNRLIITPGITVVRLHLSVEEAVYQSYSAVLETVEGQEVWSRRGLRAQSNRSGKAVVMSLPANLLSQRDYILTLRGASAAGEVEDVGEYSFRVIKR